MSEGGATRIRRAVRSSAQEVTRMFPSSVLLTAVLGFAQQPAVPASSSSPVSKPYKLNQRVEEFSLPDLAGEQHSVFAESAGKALVVVFWSQRDPVSRYYVPILSALAQKYADKAAFYLIDSNYDELVGGNMDPLDAVRRYVQDEQVTLPILIDRDNRVADDFAALANSQAFLIDPNRFLRYHGGIDDDPQGKRAKKGIPVLPRLADALDIVLEGGRPEHNWTQPAGRVLKRAPKAEPGAPAKGQ